MRLKIGRAEWIDIVRPTKMDLDGLKKKFHLHEIILKELESPSARAHVENYGEYLYMVYYFPVYDSVEETSRRHEIDFVITENAVITVHYEPLEALDGLKNLHFEDSFQLAYTILGALLRFQDRQLRHIGEKVEDIGNLLFKNSEKDALRKISRLKRDISEYRIIARHEGPLLSSFHEKSMKFWGESMRIYLDDLVGEHLKVVNQLEDYREAITDFEDTNNQLMNLKIGEVMKTFTTLSFLTFPFMLLASLFSMNTKGTPIVDSPYAFWIVLVIMVIGMSSLLAYFKKRGWL